MENEEPIDSADPIARGLVKKRKELLALRRDLERQIRAIDRCIVLLGQTVQIFDTGARIHVMARNLKPKRLGTTRYVLDVLREASQPMTAIEIAQEWMRIIRVVETPAMRRLYRSRASSALQAGRSKGVIVSEPREDGQTVWRLAD